MKTMKHLLLAFFAVALIASAASAATADSNQCEGTKLTASLTTENNSGVAGQATLCISARGVAARVNTNGVTSGNPYTFWFIYFDNPANCLVPGACTDADVFTPTDNPEGAFGRYDSLTPRSSSGTFAGHSALQPSSGSVVRLEILSHGTLSTDGKIRARQLLTPQIPILGTPGLGTDSDGTVGLLAADVEFVIP
jgi:hypothetical protein